MAGLGCHVKPVPMLLTCPPELLAGGKSRVRAAIPIRRQRILDFRLTPSQDTGHMLQRSTRANAVFCEGVSASAWSESE
jgi:hypothetical protein